MLGHPGLISVWKLTISENVGGAQKVLNIHCIFSQATQFTIQNDYWKWFGRSQYHGKVELPQLFESLPQSLPNFLGKVQAWINQMSSIFVVVFFWVTWCDCHLGFDRKHISGYPGLISFGRKPFQSMLDRHKRSSTYVVFLAERPNWHIFFSTVGRVWSSKDKTNIHCSLDFFQGRSLKTSNVAPNAALLTQRLSNVDVQHRVACGLHDVGATFEWRVCDVVLKLCYTCCWSVWLGPYPYYPPPHRKILIWTLSDSDIVHHPPPLTEKFQLLYYLTQTLSELSELPLPDHRKFLTWTMPNLEVR